jgi:hypothetical protein
MMELCLSGRLAKGTAEDDGLLLIASSRGIMAFHSCDPTATGFCVFQSSKLRAVFAKAVSLSLSWNNPDFQENEQLCRTK